MLLYFPGSKAFYNFVFNFTAVKYSYIICDMIIVKKEAAIVKLPNLQ